MRKSTRAIRFPKPGYSAHPADRKPSGRGINPWAFSPVQTSRGHSAGWGLMRSRSCWGAAGLASCSRHSIPHSGGLSRSKSWRRSLPQAQRPVAGLLAKRSAAAAVVHDHVVAIHAVDAWNGLPYLVMPFIPGQSLQERVDRDGPMDLKQVLRIGIQTAQGLESAHAQGLVHRDVKPSNILLENGVERGQAHGFRPGAGGRRRQPHAEWGRGRDAAVHVARAGPRRAGRSSFRSVQPGERALLHVRGPRSVSRQLDTGGIERVSDEHPRPIRAINPDVPVWMAEIIERLHAKNPVDRFSSAGEVAELFERALAAVQRGLPVEVAPRKQAAAGRRFPRKNTAIGVLSIGGIALALAFYARKDNDFGHRFGYFPAAALSGQTIEDGQAIAMGDDPEEGVIMIVQSADSKLIVGSGKPVEKVWDVAGFSRILIRSTIHAKITKGSSFKVTTTADDNVLPFVKVEKDGDRLTIGLEKGHSFQLRKPLEAQVVLPALAGLELAGASAAELDGFDSEKDVAIHVSGSSVLKGGARNRQSRHRIEWSEHAGLDRQGAAGRAVGTGVEPAQATRVPDEAVRGDSGWGIDG